MTKACSVLHCGKLVQERFELLSAGISSETIVKMFCVHSPCLLFHPFLVVGWVLTGRSLFMFEILAWMNTLRLDSIFDSATFRAFRLFLWAVRELCSFTAAARDGGKMCITCYLRVSHDLRQVRTNSQR